MTRFDYYVRDGRGELDTGTLEAANLVEAGRRLRGDGKFIVKLEPAEDASSSNTPPTPTANAVAAKSAATKATRSTHNAADDDNSRPPGRIRRSEVITFAHQIAVMVETGVPISEALYCVSQQITNPAFKHVLDDVATQVEAGGEFSTALESYPKIFPKVMTSLIRASEVSGTMGPMLDRISLYLAKEHQTAKKIRGAMMYPAFMVLMVTAVTIFLLTFVLPKFADIYASRGAALPKPTRFLLALSDALTGHPYLWLSGVVVLLAALIVTVKTQRGRRLIDYLKLHTPVLGPVFTKLYITRGCRTMGTMIAAGVPILDMVAIVRHVTENAYYQDLWDEVDGKLRQGAQLSETLFTAPKLIPRSVSQMISSGEKSGRLAPTMERIAEFTESEFDEQVKTSTQFIEPALVGAMGCIIGFVAIAMLLPIFSIGKVVAGGG